MVMLIVGACAAVIALVAVTIYARRALKEALLVRALTFSEPAYRQRALLFIWSIHLLCVMLDGVNVTKFRRFQVFTCVQ